ncbi:Clp protease N-terminal domain-containing protein [Geodermatophilus marinus]|uniref:Clp protease N-terminal domain-containing protein n=1 Tax=Geodermatophilus sp. LHW52908 TaxID=2303986 RepID=UPI000E3EB276|nr:Clp protease N-terminal domain-containing protein [Geodermatophilus sp. LHW52908]RFU20034.1 Clp protease [Geodermatophilus sp. LHW52908]
MFERFTTEARQVVVGAQQEARRLRADRVGTEHLLLGLLASEGGVSAGVLTRHGLTRDAVAGAIRAATGEELDADALSAVGIDLDAVRDTVEAAFGPGALDAGRPRGPARGGHVPFTPRAKKVLELALREAIALRHRRITDGHVLLGLLREGQGLAMKVLHDRGVDPVALRQDVRSALGS